MWRSRTVGGLDKGIKYASLNRSWGAGKLLAFSGPAAVAEVFYGYKTKVPEDYWKYFKAKRVTAVVRLNKPVIFFLLPQSTDCSLLSRRLVSLILWSTEWDSATLLRTACMSFECHVVCSSIRPAALLPEASGTTNCTSRTALVPLKRLWTASWKLRRAKKARRLSLSSQPPTTLRMQWLEGLHR